MKAMTSDSAIPTAPTSATQNATLRRTSRTMAMIAVTTKTTQGRIIPMSQPITMRSLLQSRTPHGSDAMIRNMPMTDATNARAASITSRMTVIAMSQPLTGGFTALS